MNKVREFARIRFGFALLIWASTLSLSALAFDDILKQARDLSSTGHRPEAIQMLQKHLSDEPSDTDARVLLGAMLSWSERYDEARTELNKVLEKNPKNGDAVSALLNVELWSGHPERAEEMARENLRNDPNDTRFLLVRARALHALKRDQQAQDVLDKLLDIDPRDAEARKFADTLRDSARVREIYISQSGDFFSDHRDPWRETQIQVSDKTPLGSLIGRYSFVDRFSSTSHQAEVDFYPHIRKGTYAYLNVGVSPDATLYPRYRVGADLYQSLPVGFEITGGFRHLGFTGPVNIYTGALSKYYGNWLFTVRSYVTPGDAGTSASVHGSARYYYGESADYWGVRYGRGSTPAQVTSLYDLTILNSDVLALEFSKRINRRFTFGANAVLTRADRTGNPNLKDGYIATSLAYRF